MQLGLGIMLATSGKAREMSEATTTVLTPCSVVDVLLNGTEIPSCWQGTFSISGADAPFPPLPERKRRFAAPASVLVSGLVISQTRRQTAEDACTGSSAFEQLYPSRFCLSDDDDMVQEPFGLDPVFLPTSSLFGPKLGAGAHDASKWCVSAFDMWACLLVVVWGFAAYYTQQSAGHIAPTICVLEDRLL